MIDRLSFWLGEDAREVWEGFLSDQEAEEERLRHLPEEDDE